MMSVDRFYELVDEMKDTVDFIHIYLAEAHATNGWKLKNNYDINQHTIIEERFQAANMLQEILNAKYSQELLSITPIYVDTMDNFVANKLVGYPERLLVVQNDRFVYYGGAGPFLYDIEELATFLRSNYPVQKIADEEKNA